MKTENPQIGEALAKEIWDLCDMPTEPNHHEYINLKNYYKNLSENYKNENMKERYEIVSTPNSTMCIRYRTIIGTNHSNTLYNSCLNDFHRITITRCRLSSHELKIETGRYTKPITIREDRLCKICREIENESHAIFTCRAHRWIREKNKKLFDSFKDVKTFLNPPTVDTAKKVALCLTEIEKNMKAWDKL